MIAILAPYGRNEVTLAAIRLAELVVGLGREVRLVACGGYEKSVHPLWDERVVAGRMSGGNQQKLLLAKVMERNPRVILIDEPTRGIDVGTKSQIYNFIAALAAEGAAIVVVSSEMPEVIGLCTKVAVMREGRIVGQLEGEAINETEIMRYAAGLKTAA